MKPTAYSYIRFSTADQALGNSEERQFNEASQWAKEKGMELDGSFADLGIASYRGKNRKKGALGDFLKCIEQGLVPSGSYLIVEDIDRLSREHPIDSIGLIRTLLRAGIKLVILKNKEEFTEESIRADHSGMKMLGLVFELGRASGESGRKSDLLTKTWIAKRLKASATNMAMTSVAPAWIATIVTGDGRAKERTYKLIPERVKVVRDIFDMCIRGKGARATAEHLNNLKEPNWGRGKSKATHWHPSYVKKILMNRAVLGEYQAHHSQTIQDPNDKNERIQIRVPTGNILKDYYPPIITLATFNKAKAKTNGRNKTGLTGGRTGTVVSNLFPGLVVGALPDPTGKLIDPAEPGPMPTVSVPCRYKSKGKNGHGKYLVAEVGAENKPRLSQEEIQVERWPYLAVEYAVLKTLEEINWKAVAGRRQTPEQAALADTAIQLETAAREIKEQCQNLGMVIAKTPLPTLVEQLTELEAKRTAATNEAAVARKKLTELELARGGLIKPLAIQKAAHDPTQRDVRLALRAELARRIDTIELTPKKLAPKVDPRRDRTTYLYAFHILIKFTNGITRACRVHLNKGCHPTVTAVAFQQYDGEDHFKNLPPAHDDQGDCAPD